MEKENLIFQAKNNYLKEGFSCGEALVKAIKDAKLFEIPDEVLRITSCFKTGIGKKKDLCGALLAGIVLIGLKYGRIKKEESPQKALEITRQLYEEFEKEFGSVKCGDLLKEFIKKDALESQERKEFCANNFISFVVKKIEEILKEK
ncbi:C-GCAxxG-C-C family protein [bacterium]|nr:C-GCAxxG-C-C family protein [bacterium]